MTLDLGPQLSTGILIFISDECLQHKFTLYCIRKNKAHPEFTTDNEWDFSLLEHVRPNVYSFNMTFKKSMGLNRELKEKKMHYTMDPLLFFFSRLTATVEPFFPTPPARMTDMLLCASKIAMPTAAHNGNTFTSVPVYGNCISDTKDLLISRRKLVFRPLVSRGLSNTLCIPDHTSITVKWEVRNMFFALETISCFRWLVLIMQFIILSQNICINVTLTVHIPMSFDIHSFK